MRGAGITESRRAPPSKMKLPKQDRSTCIIEMITSCEAYKYSRVRYHSPDIEEKDIP